MVTRLHPFLPPSSEHHMREYHLEKCCSSLQYSSAHLENLRSTKAVPEAHGGPTPNCKYAYCWDLLLFANHLLLQYNNASVISISEISVATKLWGSMELYLWSSRH